MYVNGVSRLHGKLEKVIVGVAELCAHPAARPFPPLLCIRAEVAGHFAPGNADAAFRDGQAGLAVIEKYNDPAQRDRTRQAWLEWKQEMEERQAAMSAAIPAQT